MALINKLTAIADAIREKTGDEEELSLDDMVTAIGGIETGGGGGDYPFKVLTGNISYLFSGKTGFGNTYMTWLRDDVKVTTSHLTSVSSTFDGCTGDWSWLILDCDDNCILTGMLGNNFDGVPPLFKHSFVPTPNQTAFMSNNQYLTEVPENYVQNILINEVTPGSISSLFHSVKRMRAFPQSWVSSESLYPTMNFDECYSVDELLNVFPYDKTTLTVNIYNYVGYRCSHLKRLTFKTNNGQPYVRQWKNQIIRLGDRTGWFNASTPQYGFLANKKLDSDYENLKNDSDAWAANLAYSRYDHDSAVETINSLPDTSAYLATAGGSNTIQFKTGAGSATDAGAVSDMTAAEIAVATEKGWTVTFI